MNIGRFNKMKNYESQTIRKAYVAMNQIPPPIKHRPIKRDPTTQESSRKDEILKAGLDQL